MNIDLGSIHRKRDAKSRSISAENPTGERGKGAMADPGGEGAARELGVGWKVSPCLRNVKAGETKTIMDVSGPGVIRHGMTAKSSNRASLKWIAGRELFENVAWRDAWFMVA
ncbi:MAG: hypothetical protein ACLFWL_09255 [Candidatus Brocadiia bacterium]